MTKTPSILGHVPCPICPNDAAEVRLDRNQLAYIYCASGCYTQVFTRDKHRDGLLRARLRPIAAAAAIVAAPAPAAVPVPEPAVAPTAASPVPVPVPPQPPKPRNTWLTTLLDGAPTK